MNQSATVDVSRLPNLVSGPRAPVWWAIVFLVAIETTVFGTLIASYFYLSLGEPQWPPAGIEPPKLLLPTINTVILLASSVAMHQADAAIGRGDERRMSIGAAVAVGLAALFLGLKVVEYSGVDYRWDTHSYASIVWTITGFHAAHVMALIFKTIIVGVQSRVADFRQGRRLVVQSNGIYWHFVVAIWIPLYAVLYWAPRLM
jgi:heme/copper-type cytochrome/quinol oxidase subunit 3